jgi:formylglycine-generating enzyme required for sulfatase activity
MVYVPEGSFQMGSTGAQYQAAMQMCFKSVTKPRDCERNYDDELPAHTVYLDAFWIDRTDVTNGMYAKCVEAGKCKPPHDIKSATHPDYYSNSLYADYPVINVNWDQADTYCKWAGRSLPTEAQWEKAARGTDSRTFPWGEGIDCQKANYTIWGTNKCVGDTTKVGSYPTGASPYGALDMAGNVFQWVADWDWDYTMWNYYAHSPDKNPTGPASGQSRVIRGGSWYLFDTEARSASRSNNVPTAGDNSVGFRCATHTTFSK